MNYAFPEGRRAWHDVETSMTPTAGTLQEADMLRIEVETWQFALRGELERIAKQLGVKLASDWDDKPAPNYVLIDRIHGAIERLQRDVERYELAALRQGGAS